MGCRGAQVRIVTTVCGIFLRPIHNMCHRRSELAHPYIPFVSVYLNTPTTMRGVLRYISDDDDLYKRKMSLSLPLPLPWCVSPAGLNCNMCLQGEEKKGEKETHFHFKEKWLHQHRYIDSWKMQEEKVQWWWWCIIPFYYYIKPLYSFSAWIRTHTGRLGKITVNLLA